MKRVLLVLATGAILVGGCASSGNSGGASPLASLRAHPLLQNAARGLAIAKYSDKAFIAARNEDESALEKASAGLESVAPLLAAEHLVRDASRLDARAQFEKNPAFSTELKNQAGQKYRTALKTAPDFDSRNPELLNALGYFLAERGVTTPDFQKAEKLTRRSLELWDDLVSQAQNSSLPGAGNLLSLRRFARANVRDSLAWALFRQGEYAQALNEQQEAVSEAEKSTPELGEKVPAELYYHLGEIERALKHFDAAKTWYQKALQVEPDHALSQRALQNLKTP
jgi:tetratricopeptide (TPR) repeat protein